MEAHTKAGTITMAIDITPDRCVFTIFIYLCTIFFGNASSVYRAPGVFAAPLLRPPAFHLPTRIQERVLQSSYTSKSIY